MKKEQEIKFSGKTHTKTSLGAMDDADLLSLRNLVAENLGVSRIKNFKDHAQAVDATWKALTKWDSDASESESSKAKKEPKAPAEPAKCGNVQKVSRPTRGMFRRLQKIAEHPGKGFRIRRWDNYKDGMTLLDCAEGQDMTPLDVGFYVDNGLMKLIEPTEDEFQAGLDAWYKKHGLENPAEAKRKRDEERAAAKAAKAAEREAKKKEREEAKAQKAKERAEAKAAKEAAKAEKAAAKADA